MSQVNDFIRQRVGEITSQKDFDKYIEKVKMSSAPIEARNEVIQYAETKHPGYATVDQSPTEEILHMIKEGSADISDMNGH